MTGLEEFRAHGKLLLGCVLGMAIGVHSLPFYTAGMFLMPLIDAFGWSRAAASLAPTLLILSLGLVAPFAGMVIDKIGERRAAFISLLCVGISFLLLSRMQGALYFYLALFSLMALTGAGASTITFSRLIVRNFQNARGTALGIAMTGTGIASSLAALTLVPLIAEAGWRTGYLVLAVVIFAGAPIIWFLTGEKRKDAQEAPRALTGQSLREALRTSIFWKLVAAFFLVALASPGALVHFVPLLVDAQVSPERAAALASLVGVFLILGRLGAGILFDIAFAPYVAALFMALSAAGLAILAWAGPEFAVLGALAIGLSFGAEMDLVGYLCARYFGTRHYGKIYGVLYTVVLGGIALSPLLYGALRDSSGNYDSALYSSTLLLGVSVFIFLSLPRFLPSSQSA